MKKTTSTGITNSERSRKRTLRLAQETVKTLSSGELSQAIGGSGCITTSWSTEPANGGG